MVNRIVYSQAAALPGGAWNRKEFSGDDVPPFPFSQKAEFENFVKNPTISEIRYSGAGVWLGTPFGHSSTTCNRVVVTTPSKYALE